MKMQQRTMNYGEKTNICFIGLAGCFSRSGYLQPLYRLKKSVLGGTMEQRKTQSRKEG